MEPAGLGKKVLFESQVEIADVSGFLNPRLLERNW